MNLLLLQDESMEMGNIPVKRAVLCTCRKSLLMPSGQLLEDSGGLGGGDGDEPGS